MRRRRTHKGGGSETTNPRRSNSAWCWRCHGFHCGHSPECYTLHVSPIDIEPGRIGKRTFFVLSAATAAGLLHLAWHEPVLGAIVLVIASSVLFGKWHARRRIHRLLQSGDVRGVLDRWSRTSRRLPHAPTMAPLMTATAFAAYGWTERAREALREAERGPAWDASLEHRLFLDALLATFEGDVDMGVEHAERLQRLPVPPAPPSLVERIRVLRRAVLALARAFAHDSREGDRQVLLEASATSPLVHWAMRYAAAIVAIDAGEMLEAARLIERAPAWPTESCFARFHREIGDEIARHASSNEPPTATSPSA